MAGVEIDSVREIRRIKFLLMEHGLQTEIYDTPIYIRCYHQACSFSAFSLLLWFQYQRSVFELLLSLPTPKAESTSRNGVCRRLLLYKILTPTLSNARKSDNLQIASSFLPSKRNDSSDRTTFSFCVRHLKLPIISLPLSVSSVHLYKVTIAPKGWSCYNH
ncbi:unnamed protein product [Albugo candida]|uniref:Uncharacterized protein n=1 Tax=Albugo candida TaxID=65357 RepID=A0A024FUA3_9STRA|nr:unnamed protein product [Albugo candida]|eukprot:CCI10738.1 unnamed protein product [Albugo candida]